MTIKTFFQTHQLVITGKTLLVAVSAGPDSMALLEMLRQFPAVVIAAHFDHQLRSDTKQESQLLQAYCHRHQLRLIEGSWPKEKQPASGIEAAARSARYDFLTRTAKQVGADFLLTAHHGDDLIENELLKWLRSGLPYEMASMQAIGQMRGIPLLRPLLAVSKADLTRYNQKHHVPYVVDGTNLADGTLRNRLRHHVVPQLKQESPQLGAHALIFSEQMQVMQDLLAKIWQQLPVVVLVNALRISAEQLVQFSPAEQQLFWQYQIWHHYHERVQQLGKYRLLSYQGQIYLLGMQPATMTAPFSIQLDVPFRFAEQRFMVTTQQRSDAQLVGTFVAPAGPLSAGSLAPNQRLLLKNGQHVRSKKKFAEHAIPAVLRPSCLAIFTTQQPVFVAHCYQNQVSLTGGVRYWVYRFKKV